MKTNYLLRVLLLFFCMVGFISCSEDDGQKYYDSVPEGGSFYRGNTVRFYYMDEDGNNVIRIGEAETYPRFCETKEGIPEVPTPDKQGLYAGNVCQVGTDEEGKAFFSITVPGDERSNAYVFYVYCNEGFDQMDLTYGYTRDALGGDGWYAHILSWKVNGTHVYADKEGQERVYVQRMKGQTKVWSK